MAMHLTRHGCIHLSLPPSIWSIIYHRLTYARRLNLPTHTTSHNTSFNAHSARWFRQNVRENVRHSLWHVHPIAPQVPLYQ